MTIVACGCTGHCLRCTPPVPLAFNPAATAAVDVDPNDLAPMLVLPGDLRIRVDAAEAAAWWHALAIAALTAALFYEELARAGAEEARPPLEGPEPVRGAAERAAEKRSARADADADVGVDGRGRPPGRREPARRTAARVGARGSGALT